MMRMTRVAASLLVLGLVSTTLLAQATQPGPEAPQIRPTPSTPATPAQDGKTDGTAATNPAQNPQGTSQGGGMNQTFLFIMLGVMVLLWVWMGRGRKKQEAKRQEMLNALKKGDKITTIGGIIGTVIESRENEIVIKVDESNNVRMRFARWAIRGVGDEGRAEKPEDKDQQQVQKS